MQASLASAVANCWLGLRLELLGALLAAAATILTFLRNGRAPTAPLPGGVTRLMAVVTLLLHVLALPRGTVVVEASSQPLASGPPPMDGATPGSMPPPDYSHIPEEMLPSPGEASPLADVMAWHSQRTGQGMAAEAHGMHGPSAQDVVTSASAGQAMTAAAPVGQMHSMPAPDFSAIPAGTPAPPRTSPVTRSPAFALAWFG